MGFKTRYENLLPKFLSDNSICEENRKVFKDYFSFQERKLKSIHGLRELDESSYKTLYAYIMMFKNVNRWFGNKPLKKITKANLKQVYEDLEDGKIKNSFGKPFEDRESYYSKIFKGKLFKMIKKYEIADEVLEFWKPTKNGDNVKFFTEEDFRSMELCAIKLSHKVLLNLLWDIGENVFSILKLQVRECIRNVNDLGEPEYNIVLSKEKLKRSRTARTEPTNYPQTTKLLDMYFKQGKKEFVENPNGKDVLRITKIKDGKKVRSKVNGSWIVREFRDDDYLFDFGQKQAEKIFRRVVEKSGVVCKPKGETPTIKDIRSSMACHLLKEGWSVDEVKGRMGHKPSSQVIDKYASYLALDKGKPKKKIYESNLAKVNLKLEETQQREKLQSMRLEETKKQVEQLSKMLEQVMQSGGKTLRSTKTKLLTPEVR